MVAEGNNGANTGQGSPEEVGCYGIKTPDLAQIFAPFGRRPMPDWAIWSLSLAQSCQPEGSVGFEVWISRASGSDIHTVKLREWARGLAETLATVKPKINRRHRLLFETYSPVWGNAAADDAVELAITGRCPPTASQADKYGVHRKCYARMRGLIAGFMDMQAWQYQDALAWAVKQNVGPVFE
jgi:hypothetical protein